MVLLAYTIFTITMVLQRKQAARGLALGLATLTIPAVPLLLLGPVPAGGDRPGHPRARPLPRASAGPR